MVGWWRKTKFRFAWTLLIIFLLWPVAFISIYSRPHSRVTASEWIYQNIPPGSSLAVEHWDDGLPLPLSRYPNFEYQHIQLPLYDPDSPAKWQEIATKLDQTDYVLLTSNRLYGSITGLPGRYPATSRYYQLLFDGALGFAKIAEFTSRPNLPVPFIKLCLTPSLVRYGWIARKVQDCPATGLNIVDDYGDETFTVYDHPKVIILQKINPADYLKLLVK